MSINPKDIFTEGEIVRAKALGEFARKIFGSDSFMSEAELTEDERESRVPLHNSDFGYYRMYRWECLTCRIHGRKSPYTKAIEDGYRHFVALKHRKNTITVIGGVFKKEDLGKK